MRPLRRRGSAALALGCRPPRLTARLRLALLYACVFIACGAGLLAITYLLVSLHGSSGDQIPAPRPPGTLLVPRNNASALNPTQHAADLHTLLIMSAIALALMAAVSGLLGWLIAGRVLRPLRTITATARDISASNLHRRLGLPGPDDELKELGDTLDALLGRLEIAFESQRRFVSSASHELRTPLARLKTIMQVALIDPDAPASSLRSAHQRALATEQQLEELIDALLALASGEHALEHAERVDLAETTQNLLDRRADELERRQLVVNAELEHVICEGSQQLLERLLANLLDNAIRHNTPGGWIKITTTSTQPGKATVTVANSGAVIPSHDVDRLTQPFQRLAGERARSDGHGLGLSIVAAITAAHHGSLQLHAQVGGGLHIEVTIPSPPTKPQPERPTRSQESSALLGTHTPG